MQIDLSSDETDAILLSIAYLSNWQIHKIGKSQLGTLNKKMQDHLDKMRREIWVVRRFRREWDKNNQYYYLVEDRSGLTDTIFANDAKRFPDEKSAREFLDKAIKSGAMQNKEVFGPVEEWTVASRVFYVDDGEPS